MNLFKSNLTKALASSLILSSFLGFNLPAEANVNDCANVKGLKISANDDFCAEVSGFVRLDLYYDTRQTTTARDTYFTFYPKNIKKNDAGIDENAVSNFNLGSILTRGRIKVYSPDVFGANVFGIVEGDFFGSRSDTSNHFILRHSYVKMNWTQYELLLGQHWSPLFNTEVFPQTVEFNTGAPIAPIARFPQMILTAKPTENIKIYGGISMQSEPFRDIEGKIKQESSGVPSLHLHSDFISKNFTFGLGSYLRTIRPELTANTFESGAVAAYTKIVPIDALKIRASALFGSDMADHIMTGGYIKTDDGKFKPLNVFSGWLDLDYNITNELAIGLYSGYSTNLGTFDKAVAKEFFTRGHDINYIFRVSPRIMYKVDKFAFGLELDSTRALYASTFTDKMKPLPTQSDIPVNNFRIILSTYYYF